ncbi:MAG TPA: hypothetical protein PK668_18295 [Myxococcota bacterium]|nr:hypothetical protein [Myxococcota bacterium]HRY95915.1 hypothetical protein [Myxococcota bacterium]
MKSIIHAGWYAALAIPLLMVGAESCTGGAGQGRYSGGMGGAKIVGRGLEFDCPEYQYGDWENPQKFYLFPRIIKSGERVKIYLAVEDDVLIREKNANGEAEFSVEVLHEKASLTRVGFADDLGSLAGTMYWAPVFLGTVDVETDVQGWVDVNYFNGKQVIGTRSILVTDGTKEESSWTSKVVCRLDCGKSVQLDHVLVYVDRTPVEYFTKIVAATGGTLGRIVSVGFGQEPYGNCYPSCYFPYQGVALDIILPEAGFHTACGALDSVEKLGIPGVKVAMPTKEFGTVDLNPQCRTMEFPVGDCH